MDKTFIVILVIAAIGLPLLSIQYSSYASDEAFYMNVAQDLANGKGYTGDIIPPLFSVAIAFFFLVTKNIEIAARAVNIVAVLITSVTIYYFTKHLIGKSSRWAPIIFLTLPMISVLGTRILPDALFNMFFVLSVYFFFKSIKKNEIYFTLVGAFTALAFFTRFAAVLLIPIFLVYFLLDKKSFKIFRSRYVYFGIATFAILFLGINFAFFGSGLDQYREALFSYTVTNVDEPFYFYLQYFPLVPLFVIPFFLVGIFSRRKIGKALKSVDLRWIAVSTAFLVLYKLFFLPVREYRYLIDTSLFITLLATFGIIYFSQMKSTVKYYKYVAIALVFINLVAGAYIFNGLANSPRYIETKEASLWADENCSSPIVTNAGRHTDFYTSLDYLPLLQKSLDSAPDSCILYSAYEPADENVVEKIKSFGLAREFGGVVIYLNG